MDEAEDPEVPGGLAGDLRHLFSPDQLAEFAAEAAVPDDAVSHANVNPAMEVDEMEQVDDIPLRQAMDFLMAMSEAGSSTAVQQRGTAKKRTGRDPAIGTQGLGRNQKQRGASPVPGDADGNPFDDDDMWGDEQPPPPTASRTHRIRVEREHRQWASQREQLHRTARGTVPLNAGLRVLRERRRREELQELVQGSWQLGCPRGCAASAIHQSESVEVEYFSLEYRFMLTVPRWHCTGCGAGFNAEAQHAGCWPSSPTQPRRWYDIGLMHMYSYLGLRAGVSATGRLQYPAVQSSLQATMQQCPALSLQPH